MHLEAFPSGMDPVRAALRLQGRPQLAWLDGHAGHGSAGRWSFVASDPAEIVAVTWAERARLADALERLDQDLRASRERCRDACNSPLHPAQTPRWIGFLAYDALYGLDGRALPRRRRGDDGLIGWFARYPALYAYDHETGRGYLAGDDAAACVALAGRLADAPHAGRPSARLTGCSVAAPADHLAALRTALEQIARGNVYQVNLARTWQAHFEGSPLALALAMREASPVPLGAYVAAAKPTLIARTMERFLRWDRGSGRIETRPIKGTIRRDGTADAADARTLLKDPKERAEHTMIVDLMRNDLGRIAQVGTVQVERVMEVEPYAKLSHLVSTVTAQVRPDLTLPALLAATFPPGSVTGTPKIRAMELIEALEPTCRGAYTGAVGYLDRAGGLSLAVAIRTAQVRDAAVTYHAGGGIVEASVPEREVAETDLKARAFLDAVEALERGTPFVLESAAQVVPA